MAAVSKPYIPQNEGVIKVAAGSNDMIIPGHGLKGTEVAAWPGTIVDGNIVTFPFDVRKAINDGVADVPLSVKLLYREDDVLFDMNVEAGGGESKRWKFREMDVTAATGWNLATMLYQF